MIFLRQNAIGTYSIGSWHFIKIWKSDKLDFRRSDLFKYFMFFLDFWCSFWTFDVLIFDVLTLSRIISIYHFNFQFLWTLFNIRMTPRWRRPFTLATTGPGLRPGTPTATSGSSSIPAHHPGPNTRYLKIWFYISKLQLSSSYYNHITIHKICFNSSSKVSAR